MRLSLTCLAVICLLPDASWSAVDIPNDLPYGQDVSSWWQQHVFDPDSTNYDAEIRSPPVRARLEPGDRINEAIAALPVDGGTIILAKGVYEPFKISKRKNIHIIAPEGATVTGSSRLEGTTLNYHNFVVAIRVSRDPAAIDDFINKKTRNIYIKGLTFDGKSTEIYAVVSDCVEAVLFEDCTFQNYRRHPNPAVANHVAMVIGCMGTDNIWYRSCTFKCDKENPPGNALYHDGIHVGGCIGCTVDAGFTSAGFLFLNNDDYTFDHNGNGVFEQVDVRLSRFVVIYGCSFRNLRAATRMTAADSLVMKCNGKGHFEQAFCFFNPKTSLIYPQNIYDSVGNRVLENRVESAGALAEFDSNDDFCPKDQNNKARVGRFFVTGNVIGSCKELVRIEGPMLTPYVIRDNSF